MKAHCLAAQVIKAVMQTSSLLGVWKYEQCTYALPQCTLGIPDELLMVR